MSHTTGIWTDLSVRWYDSQMRDMSDIQMDCSCGLYDRQMSDMTDRWTQGIHHIGCLDEPGVEIVYSTHSSVGSLDFLSFF